jgi:hypothetical protein
MTDPTLIFAASAAVGARAGLGGGLVPEDVSPGVIGFLVTLALVLACIPIFRSMTGKLRGVQHRNPPGESAEDGAPGDHPDAQPGPVAPAGDERPGAVGG